MHAADERTKNNKGRGMVLTHYPSMDALTDIHADRMELVFWRLVK